MADALLGGGVRGVAVAVVWRALVGSAVLDGVAVVPAVTELSTGEPDETHPAANMVVETAIAHARAIGCQRRRIG